jgi:hypothetical protein
MELEEFIENTVGKARTGGDVAIFLATSGSFGEIFSLMWEVLFNEDLAEHGAAVERLIAGIPTVSHVEGMGARSGLVNVNTQTATEALEFDNGAKFIASPLVADFLMPIWLESLDDDEKERAVEQLAQLIDADDGALSFRFSVKVTLLTGEKN